MRIGSNAASHPRTRLSNCHASPARWRPPHSTYDRSELILGSVETLTDTLIQQAIIVTIICLVFLFHARSALIVMIVLPLSVLLSFIAIRYLGLSSNIMSLGGIAIAIGELADAAIVLIETRTSVWRRLRPEQTGNGSSSTPARKSVARSSSRCC